MEKRSRDQLLDDWEVSSMEEEDCCCGCGCKGGAEAGVHLQASRAQYARRRASRRRAAVAVVGLLLLGALAALITVGLWKRWDVSPENSQVKDFKCERYCFKVRLVFDGERLFILLLFFNCAIAENTNKVKVYLLLHC